MGEYYILKGRKVVPTDLMTWSKMFQNADKDRIVCKSNIDDSIVSTVFLGLNHSFTGTSLEVFETLVFGGPLDGEMTRCATLDQAEKMHVDMCVRVKLAQLDETLQEHKHES